MNCELRKDKLTALIYSALKEDIGKGDITTRMFIPRQKNIRVHLIAKEKCVICGLDIANLVFKLRDRGIRFKAKVRDGQMVSKGRVIAQISGRARSILTAERVALNFLSLLSGIATKTRKYVEIIRSYKVKIMDTRKTIPNFRELEKYAVRVGGGYNHRFKLDEMVLVKDNHLKVIGGPGKVKKTKTTKKIEIEVKNLKEFKKTLKLNPDIIMLDNMDTAVMRKAVWLKDKLKASTHKAVPKLEASGGINLKNIRKVASSGVDMISLGDLTHSVKSADISLEVL